MSLLPLVKRHLEQHTALGEIPHAPVVAAGVVAGVLGSLCTHPADTIKTRMQVGACVLVLHCEGHSLSGSRDQQRWPWLVAAASRFLFCPSARYPDHLGS